MTKPEFDDLSTAASLIQLAYSAKTTTDRARVAVTLNAQRWRGLEWFGDPSGRGVQFFTARLGDVLWVPIPGTNHSDDWKDYNLKPGCVTPLGVRGVFREGFDIAAWDAWKMLLERDFLDLVRFGSKRVILVGHSLAGPIVGGLAARLKGVLAYSDRQKVTPITLASPRFCDGEAVVELERFFPSARRYRLGADLVPDLVAGWPAPWRHVWPLVTLQADATTSTKYPRAKELWRAMRRPKLNLVSDHGISEWVDWCAMRKRTRYA